MTDTPTRRTVLAGTASPAAGLSGCSGVNGSDTSHSREPPERTDRRTRDAVEADLTVEVYGSRHAAQLVAEGSAGHPRTGGRGAVRECALEAVVRVSLEKRAIPVIDDTERIR